MTISKQHLHASHISNHCFSNLHEYCVDASCECSCHVEGVIPEPVVEEKHEISRLFDVVTDELIGVRCSCAGLDVRDSDAANLAFEVFIHQGLVKP